VLWHCWLGHQTCKNRRPYNLYCVGADVKPCSIQFNSYCSTKPCHHWTLILFDVYQLLCHAVGFWQVVVCQRVVHALTDSSNFVFWIVVHWLLLLNRLSVAWHSTTKILHYNCLLQNFTYCIIGVHMNTVMFVDNCFVLLITHHIDIVIVACLSTYFAAFFLSRMNKMIYRSNKCN